MLGPRMCKVAIEGASHGGGYPTASQRHGGDAAATASALLALDHTPSGLQAFSGCLIQVGLPTVTHIQAAAPFQSQRLNPLAQVRPLPNPAPTPHWL